MNGIEYAYTEGEREYRTVTIPVRFTESPKVVGEIRPVLSRGFSITKD